MTSTKSAILLLPLALLANLIAAQSNYASHANNVEYTGDGLPEEATLDGKVSHSERGALDSNFNLNATP